MLELTISKKILLPALLMVFGAVSKKSNNPLLFHILFSRIEDYLVLTATDLEIQISVRISCEMSQDTFQWAVPAKKFVDIIKALDDEAVPTLVFDEKGLWIKEGRSSFKLTTLPAQLFPSIQEESHHTNIVMPTSMWVQLIQATHFAISQQDVRIFLNCLFLEIHANEIIAIGTDAHRLAMFKYPLQTNITHRLLIPRRTMMELSRWISSLSEEPVTLSIGKHYMKLSSTYWTFWSKLVESRWPAYTKAIPQHPDKSVMIDAVLLKKALGRVMIVAHEKSRAIILHMQPHSVTLMAYNQDQEEAIEVLEADTQGGDLKIGLNALYLMDVLNYITQGIIRLSFSHADDSILITSPEKQGYQYVIMPMKI